MSEFLENLNVKRVAVAAAAATLALTVTACGGRNGESTSAAESVPPTAYAPSPSSEADILEEPSGALGTSSESEPGGDGKVELQPNTQIEVCDGVVAQLSDDGSEIAMLIGNPIVESETALAGSALTDPAKLQLFDIQDQNSLHDSAVLVPWKMNHKPLKWLAGPDCHAATFAGVAKFAFGPNHHNTAPALTTDKEYSGRTIQNNLDAAALAKYGIANWVVASPDNPMPTTAAYEVAAAYE